MTMFHGVFTLSGCLGRWQPATSGMLHNCPVSIVVINVMTMVWRKAIDGHGATLLWRHVHILCAIGSDHLDWVSKGVTHLPV